MFKRVIVEKFKRKGLTEDEIRLLHYMWSNRQYNYSFLRVKLEKVIDDENIAYSFWYRQHGHSTKNVTPIFTLINQNKRAYTAVIHQYPDNTVDRVHYFLFCIAMHINSDLKIINHQQFSKYNIKKEEEL